MKKLLITVNGKQYEVDVEVLQDDDEIQTQPTIARQPVGTWQPTPTSAPVTAPRRSPVSGSNDSKTLTSPINGTVLEVAVAPGIEVKEGDVLFVLEAMKMKTNISSPYNGKIALIKAAVGDKIESGQLLLTFE